MIDESSCVGWGVYHTAAPTDTLITADTSLSVFSTEHWPIKLASAHYGYPYLPHLTAGVVFAFGARCLLNCYPPYVSVVGYYLSFFFSVRLSRRR